MISHALRMRQLAVEKCPNVLRMVMEQKMEGHNVRAMHLPDLTVQNRTGYRIHVQLN
jgi:ATP-dependent RNA circularization protein (DNA/RNA ligase family)